MKYPDLVIVNGGVMFDKVWKKEAEGDRLKQGERAGQLIGVFFSLLVLGFFVVHWTGDTGFYTDEFSSLDAAVLFGPLLFGIAPSIYRFLVGRKNVARPLEIVSNILFVLSCAYFLTIFHFNMDVFAQPFPEGLRFLIDWIDESIAKWILAIGAVGGSIGLIWNILTYIKVKEILYSKSQ